MKSRLYFILIMAMTATLGACGGGGGGGSNIVTPPVILPPVISPPIISPPPPPPPPPAIVAGVDYPLSNSHEYRANFGLSAINVQTAWARGASGKGINVAVIDTGVDANNSDLDANIKTNIDMSPTARTPDDKDMHATYVAGIIANEFNNQNNVGVAFKSNILSYRADKAGTCGTEDDCSLPETYITRAIDRAIIDGAKIINLSIGSGNDVSSMTLESALLRATNAGLVVVIASGNDAEAQVGWPGRFASDQRFKGRLIVVGATDYLNQMADFSNKAGDNKNYYLSAPGKSTKNDDGTWSNGKAITADCDANYSCYLISGTSFAAPHVSGALALLFEAFPNLTVDQAINILFESATDLGDSGTDATYGRGLLNLDKAFTAIGNVTSSLPTGEKIDISNLSGQASPAAGDAFVRANLQTGIIDKYNRSFNLNIGARINNAKRPILSVNDGYSLARQSIKTENSLINFIPQITPNNGLNNFTQDIQKGKISGENSYEFMGINVNYGFATGGMPLPNQNTNMTIGDGDRFGIYSLGMGDNAVSFGISKDKFRLDFTSSQGDTSKGLYYDGAKQQLNQIDLNINNGNLNYNIGYGNYFENGSAFGMKLRGINDVPQNTPYNTPKAETEFLNFGIKYGINQNVLLNAKAQIARINSSQYGGVFNQYKTPYADAYGIELITLLNDWQTVFGIEQPLANFSGALQYNLADAYINWNTDQTHSLRLIDLRPSARELRFSLIRNKSLSDNGYVSYGLGYILNRGNSQYSEPESHLYMRTGFRF